MAKPVQVTCRFCKKKIDRDSALKDGDRTYYCDEECKKHQINKSTYKPPKVESSDRRKLTDYMLEVYLKEGWDKHKINWEMMMKQLNNIMSDHDDWTYSQIKYVLKYMYEIIEINLFDESANGSILSLVPFYFNEAKDFAIKCKKIKDNMENIEYKEEIIKIKKNDNKRYYEDIDIESL